MSGLIAILALATLALACGCLLGFAAVRFRVEEDPIVTQIDALLPQTQCGQCGYPGCKPYAEAIAREEVAINRCPPGGQHTIDALADLLNREAIPLDETHGAEADLPTVAVIREAECIGCTKCIQACPVDAILGAAKQMHTVIAAECTGCDLCVAPCPVDCIDMVPVAITRESWHWHKPAGSNGHSPAPDPAQRIPIQNL
jgi:electron transport complex protein RnfB